MWRCGSIYYWMSQQCIQWRKTNQINFPKHLDCITSRGMESLPLDGLHLHLKGERINGSVSGSEQQNWPVLLFPGTLGSTETSKKRTSDKNRTWNECQRVPNWCLFRVWSPKLYSEHPLTHLLTHPPHRKIYQVHYVGNQALKQQDTTFQNVPYW